MIVLFEVPFSENRDLISFDLQEMLALQLDDLGRARQSISSQKSLITEVFEETRKSDQIIEELKKPNLTSEQKEDYLKKLIDIKEKLEKLKRDV